MRVMYNKENLFDRSKNTMKHYFAVDLGGTTVKMSCFREDSLLDKWEIPTVKEDGGSRILPDIAGAIANYIEKNRLDKAGIGGIGIGVPGPVSGEGVVNKCVNLGWGVFNICKTLSDLTGFPVKAGNDASVAALGECVYGGGKGAKNMVLVTLGTGVGGGIVVDGKIVDGAHGAGGEIGHIVLNRYETEHCGCGKKGCAEQYCSATGIVNTAKKLLGQTDKPSVLRKENLTCKDIFDAKDDALAAETLEQVYDDLAMLIANVCNTVNPDTVVIGGGVSKAGDVLLTGIKKNIGKYIFHGAAEVAFVLATLGNDAGIYGALELIRKGE